MKLQLAAVAAVVFAAAAAAGAQDSRPDAPRFVFVGLHGGVFEKLAPFADGLAVRVEAVVRRRDRARDGRRVGRGRAS